MRGLGGRLRPGARGAKGPIKRRVACDAVNLLRGIEAQMSQPLETQHTYQLNRRSRSAGETRAPPSPINSGITGNCQQRRGLCEPMFMQPAGGRTFRRCLMRGGHRVPRASGAA